MHKVLVFGVFDGIHEGHRQFLRQASGCGPKRGEATSGNGPKGGFATSGKDPKGGRAASGENEVFLIAAVTRDEVVEMLKGKKPQRSLDVRMRELEATGLVREVVAGDAALGSWGVIEKCMPNSIALGYDQEELGKAVREHVEECGLDIEVCVMKSYEPETYHSSILNRDAE